MRHFGKSALSASALALALWVGSPLLAGEGHGCDHAKQAKSAAEDTANKEAKCDKGKDGCCGHCCHHQDKNAKAGDKPCADHAGCKHGDAHAKGDKPCADHADCKHGDSQAAACADHSCCKDGAACCDGKACSEHDEANAG